VSKTYNGAERSKEMSRDHRLAFRARVRVSVSVRIRVTVRTRTLTLTLASREEKVRSAKMTPDMAPRIVRATAAPIE